MPQINREERAWSGKAKAKGIGINGLIASPLAKWLDTLTKDTQGRRLSLNPIWPTDTNSFQRCIKKYKRSTTGACISHAFHKYFPSACCRRRRQRNPEKTLQTLKTENWKPKSENWKAECKQIKRNEWWRWKTRNGFWAGNKKKYTDGHKSQTRQSQGATARCTTQSVNHAGPCQPRFPVAHLQREKKATIYCVNKVNSIVPRIEKISNKSLIVNFKRISIE